MTQSEIEKKSNWMFEGVQKVKQKDELSMIRYKLSLIRYRLSLIHYMQWSVDLAEARRKDEEKWARLRAVDRRTAVKGTVLLFVLTMVILSCGFGLGKYLS